MRKLATVAVLLLASAGFWIFFGDASPSTRPSSAGEEAIRRDREFHDRLRQGGRIVFSRSAGRAGERNLWIMEGDGSGQTALTTSGRDARPAWSHDGSRVAFLRRDGAGSESARIYVLDVDGGTPRKLSDTAASTDAAPRWSPDDRFIAFTHPARDDGVLHVEVRRIDVATGTETLVGGGEHPSWSPDGKLIASSLGIVDPDGAKRLRIPEGDDFAWSPDGGRIAFLRAVRGGPTATALYTMDPEGTLLRALTLHDRIDESPAWSPDGRWVAFHSRGEGDAFGTDFEIGIVAADGADARWFGTGTDPAWTPDGRGLVFTSIRDDDAPSQIWYVDVDGKNRMNLSSSAAADGEPQIRRR